MSPRRGGGNWGRGVAGRGAGGAPRSEPPVYTGRGVGGWRGGWFWGVRGNTRTLIVRRVGNTLAAHAFNSKNSVYGIVHKMCKKAPPRHPPLPPFPGVFRTRSPISPPLD